MTYYEIWVEIFWPIQENEVILHSKVRKSVIPIHKNELFREPNEQSDVRISSAMARKSRKKYNYFEVSAAIAFWSITGSTILSTVSASPC